MKTLDLRMLVPAVAAWAATLGVLPVPAAAAPVLIVAWSLAALSLAAAITLPMTAKSGRLATPARRRLTASLVLAAVSLGAIALVLTSLVAHEPGRRPEALMKAQRVQDATVVVTETVTRSSRFFDAVMVSQGSGSHAAPLSVPVVVFDGAPKRRVEIGTALRVSGAVRPTPPAEEQSALLFADAAADVVAPPPWYLAWANGLRSGLAFAATGLPGDGGALLPGLAIGDTVSVSPSLGSAMKGASLTHLTAVSGANCAVVIGLILLAGKAFGLARGVRIAAAIVVLLGFVVLVTPQPSVLRAAVMAAIVLVALSRGRPVGGVPVIGVATISLITFDPWLAADYGFALSVLATLGLVVLTAPIASWLRRWLPGWLALMIAVPTAAQLACQPVLFLLSPTIPLYGVIANLLAEPAAPVATVLGLLACVSLPVLPALGHALVDIAWIPAAWIAGVARFFAGLPGARLAWPGGVWGVAALLLITGLFVVLLLVPLRRRARRAALLGIAATLVAVITVTGASELVQRLTRPSDWQIANCDIGQGDAMIVRSAGQVAVMDTGPSAPLLTRCLQTLGITHIDLLVLSHFDLDHVAGTPAVDGMVSKAIVGPSSGQPRDARILQGLLDGGARVDRVSRGVTGVLGDLRWSVVWPLADLGDIEPGNEACVTVLFEPIGACPSGCLSSLFVGDLDEHAQDLMLEANPSLPRLDVIEVAHHGSADQSASLYQRVDAPVGLIGVGRHNRYGHPTQHLLDILAGVGTTPERTDTEGLILVSPAADPGSVAVWSERRDTGGAG